MKLYEEIFKEKIYSIRARFAYCLSSIFLFSIFHGGALILFEGYSPSLSLFSLLLVSPLLLLFAFFSLVLGRLMVSSLLSCSIYFPVDFYMQISRAQEVNLILRREGVMIFENGNITNDGIIGFLLIYSLMGASIIVAYYLVFKIMKRIVTSLSPSMKMVLS